MFSAYKRMNVWSESVGSGRSIYAWIISATRQVTGRERKRETLKLRSSFRALSPSKLALASVLRGSASNESVCLRRPGSAKAFSTTKSAASFILPLHYGHHLLPGSIAQTRLWRDFCPHVSHSGWRPTVGGFHNLSLIYNSLQLIDRNMRRQKTGWGRCVSCLEWLGVTLPVYHSMKAGRDI